MRKNVIEYLQKAVENCPEKIGFCDIDGSLTFYQMDQRAKKIAIQIIHILNQTKNRPVVVYMDKGKECLSAFFGVVYSGNFYVPIDVKSPMERVLKIFDVLEPEIIITQPEYVERLAGCGIEATLIIYDEATVIDEERLTEIIERQLDVDPLYVLFTSGTTGVPKGVVISHRAVIDYTEWLTDFFHFNADTVFGNQAPFYFDMSVLDIYSTLKNAATLYIIPEQLFLFPVELLHYLDANEINTIFWVPSALINVANSNVLRTFHNRYLRKILFAGEVMPNKQLNMWRKAISDALYANLYGPTEVTVICTCYVVDREFEDDEPLPIGYPCNNMEVLVLNEKNEECSVGEIGELCVRGIGVSMGYYGDRQRTEEVFVQNPLNKYWHDIIYRTGDLVSYNNYGEINYLGRKDYQIKHNGYRIELGEIEKASGSIEGVYRVCALYDENNRKIILCCIAEDELEEKQIYRQLKEKIPSYMLPARIILIEEFPLNANGKIDRNVLKRNILGGYL